MEKLVLIKVGGKIVEEEETLRQLLNDFAAIEGYKVLVHRGRTLGYQACRPTRDREQDGERSPYYRCRDLEGRDNGLWRVGE